MPGRSNTEQNFGWLSAHLYFEGDNPGDIYGKAADQVILKVAGPIIRQCRENEWIRRYFFIRYSQQGPHIRLRFQALPEILEQRVRPLILQQADGNEQLLSNLEWTPYEPEVERYGGPQGVRLAERFFHASSRTALELLEKIPPGERPSRLGKGLLSTLVLLYTFTASRSWCTQMADHYGTNYLRAQVPDPELQQAWMKAFEEGFDRQADKLAAYVEAAWEALESGQELTPQLDRYRERLNRIRQRFWALFKEGQLKREGAVLDDWRRAVGSIVPSYMHMMSNRLGVNIREESYLSVLIHRTLEDREERSHAKPQRAQS